LLQKEKKVPVVR